jgi:hypothetical protein
MTNKKPFNTANHKDHFIYENLPFINPEHGELPPIQWATIIDISLVKTSALDVENYITPPSYYLQITADGKVRGVTHEYDKHEDYFSVTASDSDVIFLKAFADQYPHLKPTLSSLAYYRKMQTAEVTSAQVDDENLER